ncbi:MAG TPA: hypothetical protein DDX92_07570 [Flavobacteriales bacterium]|jgi:uncharacterized coiled-coil DUF342 family protein|nr:hypothetical protein [Flavobacteriales bacterium]
MKQSLDYLKKALEYLEKCEMESPYANAVDINSAKIAIEIVELEHEIEDARQLNHLQDVEELRARRDALRKKIRPDV